MSKRPFKAQASSSRAATTGAFGGAFASHSATTSAFGSAVSPLSFVVEPPDLSSISDPNVKVSFKNLSKRDSTTKAKALEDLQSHISSLEGAVEEAVLEAWINIYPRTSIDSSRRVRLLAHAIQGQVIQSCGKRSAKHMPKVVGPWLAGLHDSDRAVAKATQDSLQLVFATPEKLHNVRKAYQQHILDFCRTVVDNESVQTLSDERTVSPDDAVAKYNRVIAACIGVIARLLTQLQPEDLSKQQEHYSELLQDKKLWDFAFYDDAVVRRSVHKLIICSLSVQTEAIAASLSTISRSFIVHGLSSDQSGSSYDYVEALLGITRAYPAVWTDHYSGKKSAASRLRQFLKQGSQAGPPLFWKLIPQIIACLPEDILPRSAPEAADMTNSMHSGIIKKEEPRPNLATAYNAYVEVVSLISNRLPENDQEKLLRDVLLPLIRQYVRPSKDDLQWVLPANDAATIVGKSMLVTRMSTILDTEWLEWTQSFIQEMKLSAPEQSKDHDRSQLAIKDQSIRLACAQEWALKIATSEEFTTLFSKTSLILVEEALDILNIRNGKPYGAAAVVETLILHCKDLILRTPQIRDTLILFIKSDMSKLYLSPSSPYLATILYTFWDQVDLKNAWQDAIQQILNSPDPQEKNRALRSLLTNSHIPQSFSLATDDESLQDYFQHQAKLALEGKTDWSFVANMLHYSTSLMSSFTTDKILADMAESLVIGEKTANSLHGLEKVLIESPALITSFVSSPKGSDLLQNLLLQTESSDEHIAHEAASLKDSIQSLITKMSGDLSSTHAIIAVVEKGLKEASPESVSIDTLVELAQDLLTHLANNESTLVQSLLPSQATWQLVLSPFIGKPLKKSLAITNPLGGSLFLIDPEALGGTSEIGDTENSLGRDIDGNSAAFRIARYTVKVLKMGRVQSLLTQEQRAILFRYLYLATQLASDNITLAGSNDLWSIYSPEIENDALEYVSEAQHLLRDWLQSSSKEWLENDSPSENTFLEISLESFRQSSQSLSPVAYHNARAYSMVISELIELHGWHTKKALMLDSYIREIQKNKAVFWSTAVLVGYRLPLSSSTACTRLCNELIAELTGFNTERASNEGLRHFVLLNAIFQTQDVSGSMIAKQRIIFFMQRILHWVKDDDQLSVEVQAESCKSLAILLPQIQDMYGSHWLSILDYITTCWSKTQQLQDDEGDNERSPIYLIHASLKLFAVIQSLTHQEESNDDLMDAWKETQDSVAKGLINLLKRSQRFPDDFHQPLKLVNELIARHIGKIPLEYTEDSIELYPLLYVESRPVQQTAFDILHRQIPIAQEQISLDIALDKRNARLPEELLSLILEAPTVGALANANFQRSMPLPLRGYLLSWLLVYDHFYNSSQKVRTDYIEHIREGEYLNGLLDFTFDFLGHDRGKPVDLSKLDVTQYTPDQLDLPEKDAQWLLAHLYYLGLKHMPSLAKSWWIDCKSRQKVISVESWTEKFISTPVITGALNSVSTWALTQASASEETVQVKVNQRAKEITAAYEVDEQTMMIVIRLPSAYPLKQASVEGINRVAVDERKWQSWLRTTQAVITFSNGSIVDGIVAWRRNVVGALKGQTECAICYSIISGDKQLPSKRCGTCKNLFHSSCLYKWFKTSGGSSCPLCRNAFSYG